jgi:DNA primase
MHVDQLFELLKSLGIENLRIRNKSITGCCPYHQEQNSSWGMAIEEPHPHNCFACGAKGSFYKFLIEIAELPPVQARRLCNMSDGSMKLPTFEKRTLGPKVIDRTELYPYDWSKRIERYLRRRGLTTDLLKKAGVVDYKPDNRVMFPWYWNGLVVGATGRALDDNPAKTLPYFETEKGRCLYLPSGSILPGKFVLVEGEIDAWKVYCSGSHNTGAVGFGNFTKQHKDLMLNSGVDFVVIFTDDDETGRRLACDIEKMIGGAIPTAAVDYAPFRKSYYDKADPGDMVRSDIRKAIERTNKYSSWPTF